MAKKIVKSEFIYFATRNVKLLIGVAVVFIFLLIAFLGPLLNPIDPVEYNVGPRSSAPSLSNWLGTTKYGQDVLSQMIHGIRSSLIVGFIGGTVATIIGLIVGFFSGYKGKWVDEALMMLTNILLVIPTLAVLIIIAAYLPYRGIVAESIIIGVTSWPWTARAVRSQTLSLRAREYVSLAKISGSNTLKIIFTEIAPNMFSYVFMAYILQFGGAILAAVGLDFIGLGPTRGTSLGLMMQNAVNEAALDLGMWWWAIPPGLAITIFVSALYFMNTGLDEIFNPKLRKL